MLTYNVTDRLSLVSLVPPYSFFFVLSKSMHFAKYCFYYSTKINKKKMLYGQKYRNTYITTHLRTKKNINKCYCPNPSTTTIADEYQVNGCQSFDNWHYTSSSFSFMYTTCNNY